MVKQGSYGKVPIHPTSPLSQWYNIPEISSLIRLYYLKHYSSTSYDVATLEDRFCNEMLQATSRSFALVIRQLPSDLRMVICIFYIVLRALDTIEDDMDLSPTIKIPLLKTFYLKLDSTTSLEDELSDLQIGEESEATLLQSFSLVQKSFQRLDKKYRAIIKDITRRMGSGMTIYVECSDDSFTLRQYNEYCYYVAGLVGEGLSNIFVTSGHCSNASIASSRRLSHSMGLLLQKTNIIRDFCEDSADGRTRYWPSDIYKQFTRHASPLSNNTTPMSVKLKVLNAMIIDALHHVPDCLEYLSAIENERSILTFCAIPQLMALASLVEMYKNEKVFTGVVKIPKGLAARLFYSASTLGEVHGWYVHFMQQFDDDDGEIRHIKEQVMDLTASTASGIIIPSWEWLNMASPLALVLCVLYLFMNKTDSAVSSSSSASSVSLPRLSDTIQVSILALLFIVVTIVFAFSGVAQAAVANTNSSPSKKKTR